MSKIRNNSNHVVIEAVSDISVTSVPHCRSHSEGGKGSLLSLHLIFINGPVWIITDSSGRVIIGKIGGIVTWLINDHFLVTEVADGVLFVVSNIASGIWSVWGATTPIISLVHVIVGCTI